MDTVETANGRLAFDTRGEGSGESTVVMLPSGAHERSDFNRLRELLPPRLRTIALDWPGHGDSPAGSGGYSAMRFADLAEEAVARLAPGGAVVLGNSVGGFAAGRLAIRRPELVRGLVLVDSGGFSGRAPQVRAFCSLMGRPGFLRRFYPTFSARYMRARSEADRAARERAIATTRDQPALGIVADLWRSFPSPEHDLRAEAGSIAAPSLVLWGARDPVIPLRVGRAVAAAIPDSRLEVLETGHCPQVSDPEGVATALLPFLDSVFATAREPAG